MSRTGPKKYRTIASALRNGGDLDVARAVAAKYAKTLDACESARDVKPLATGLFEAIDRINALEARDAKSTERTPLVQVLERAGEDARFAARA